MLAPQSWLHLAAGVRDGHSVRVNHDCGQGRTLKITRDAGGLRAFCFRCNDSGRGPAPVETLADKLRKIQELGQADSVLQKLRGKPEPAEYDVDRWEPNARLWFFRAGLSREDIGALRAYWHAPSGRVVLQYGDFWIARAIQKWQKPKYLSGDLPAGLVVRWGTAGTPTLCEDMLSAYKVGKVGYGWAVLGTKLSPTYIAAIFETGSTTVNTWLDPDAAGQRAASKIGQQLRAYGLTVRNIVSQRDPKLHTLQEIQDAL